MSPLSLSSSRLSHFSSSQIAAARRQPKPPRFVSPAIPLTFVFHRHNSYCDLFLSSPSLRNLTAGVTMTEEARGVVQARKGSMLLALAMGVDKEKVHKVIYEMSKGSKYFENEERKEALTKQKIEHLCAEFAKLTDKDISHFLKARKFGVRAAMPGFVGCKLCPDLVLVPPNFERDTYYSELRRNGLPNNVQ